jgi:HJR/Mrr/RecB family endonuclease
MAICNSYEMRVTELDREIFDCEGKIVALEKEKLIWLKDAVVEKRRLSYLRFAQWLRKPAADYSLWPLGLLLVGAGFAAVFFFIVVDSVSSSTTTAFIGSLLGAAITACVLLWFLMYPSDAALPSTIANTDIKVRTLDMRAESALHTLAAEKQKAITLTGERMNLLQSVEWRRATLLQREWRAMRDTEWENYLLEVFSALGATAQRTGKAGDQGVDLVVEIGNRRIAIQAKGYYHSVNNKAVQEAVTGKAHYQCCSAAVVTNSCFTKGAVELAHSNNCALIGEAEFTDFVMGRRTI